MVELIITEKPNAAQKIAEALADGKAIKESINKVPYYSITHGNQDIIVGCAVGHLFGLAEKKKAGMNYPVFDIEWKPNSSIKKDDFSNKYLTTLQKLAKKADSFTVACDFDVEGEVIGMNIIRFVCKQKDANRMKFSTLTKEELIESYENKSKHLEWGQGLAGETRHFLDYYYGINMSRALTAAIKSTGRFKLMSTGRVQGPALKIIVEKEKDIKAFVPVPFWQIELEGVVKKGEINALHKEDKFWEKDKALLVMKNVEGKKEGVVSSIEKNEFTQLPPVPFDLTSLQVECYRVHKIPPKATLSIAQDLYVNGYISYPRTSSQQLPPSIGIKKIITALQKQEAYAPLCKTLLAKPTLTPHNGKKTDPAHPAIYPTGITPKLEKKEEKVYDLIVRRFLATFGENAKRETVTMTIDVNGELFIAKGQRTTFKGWHELYGPYANMKEEELPPAEQGDKVTIKKISMHDKETKPPARYTPASIIKELEKRGLGTKATRAQIVDTLFQRGYVHGTSIEATNLGINVVDTLEKHVPKILDEALTRHFEEEMEEIREKTKKQDEVLGEAKEVITDILKGFKKEEGDIGAELAQAHIDTQNELSTIGKCYKCNDGDLQIRRGKFGGFIACSKYPDCDVTISLPSGLIKPAGKECKECSFPMVTVIRKGKRPQEVCVNKECPSKKIEGSAGAEALKVASGDIEKPCPKCTEGKLVLRKSIYGQFYGCSRFPKCRHTERIENNQAFVKKAKKK
ncbi:DNA topoisomerase I [Candidatus Woesearchaeota archaeon]|nr:DNA topoisomerase I [Candidatus Woesearchaeota archaeon]HIH38148.1 DNA topoisomerase I [Candidatus Woesearchaeota archaeon]HIH49399.1 DNA topoisomerase I [Candidatus Woesearchaeota archaeon]HIJ03668.1 DNA topoisomerase I [Candidatus Woesearchaeota archaeon]